MELLETLGIDLKLLLAQVLNFLVMLFILYKFAYRPILGILEKRRKMIEESVKKAEKIEQEDLAFQERKKEIMASARKEALKIIEEAKVESKKIRQDLLKKAREEASVLIERAKEQLKREKAEQFKELQKEISELVFLATSSLIKKKLDKKTDSELIERELKQMKVH